MKALALALLGLVYAALCQVLALGMAGAGHGWITPFFVAVGGFVLFPVSFVAAFNPRSSMAVLIGCAVGALALNLFLWLQTLNEGAQYFDRVGELAWFWLTLWLGGQVPLVGALIVRWRGQDPA